MSDATVTSNMKLVTGLWPSATWTDELTSMWREKFSELKDQEMLERSIRWIRPLYSSYQPELKWVMAQYGSFYDAKHPRYERAKEASASHFIVVWPKMHKYMMKEVEVATVCHDRQTAERIAMANGGRVLDSHDPSDDRLALEESHARTALASMTREKVQESVGYVRQMGMMSAPLPADTSTWTRTQVFLVLAKAKL